MIDNRTTTRKENKKKKLIIKNKNKYLIIIKNKIKLSLNHHPIKYLRTKAIVAQKDKHYRV